MTFYVRAEFRPDSRQLTEMMQELTRVNADDVANQAAHHNLRRSMYVMIDVELLKDGSFRLVP